MKLKLDENLPESLATELTALGHDVDTARQEGMTGCADPDVWAAAQAAGRFLVTQDLDFSDLRKFRPGTHYGLLLVRLPEAGRLASTRHITEAFRSEDAAAWQECFVVLSGRKLRVLRAAGGPSIRFDVPRFIRPSPPPAARPPGSFPGTRGR